eukprot:577920-Prymnesium_polylepis.1
MRRQVLSGDPFTAANCAWSTVSLQRVLTMSLRAHFKPVEAGVAPDEKCVVPAGGECAGADGQPDRSGAAGARVPGASNDKKDTPPAPKGYLPWDQPKDSKIQWQGCTAEQFAASRYAGSSFKMPAIPKAGDPAKTWSFGACLQGAADKTKNFICLHPVAIGAPPKPGESQ